jgi:hypothetical protein
MYWVIINLAVSFVFMMTINAFTKQQVRG